MKNALREKFKNNVLVKPLYRKLKNRNKIKPQPVWANSVLKLDGNGIIVKQNIVNIDTKDINNDNANKRLGWCRNSGVKNLGANTRVEFNRLGEDQTMILIAEHTNSKLDLTANKTVQADNKVILQQVPHSWLRLYPAPKRPGEPVCSVILRCVLCQLGLFTILVLWTVIWLFVIHTIEGPFEIKASQDFDREQNRLVIELATELRQITPLSPKWRSAIEDRIQEERHLTIEAVGRGARIHAGQFWNLSGTFLFTVYVMTALGFGAPVPHTILGRASALVYAILAVPTHIYLMLNASTLIVTNAEGYMKKRKNQRIIRFVVTKMVQEKDRESPNCSQNSELLKTTSSKTFGKKLMRVLSVFGMWHCIPLVAILYYACGAIGFGVLRYKSYTDSLLFPLEFTTSGGLEGTAGLVRVLYGFYVEGAMMLLACALATLRRHSIGPILNVSEKYRLFCIEE